MQSEETLDRLNSPPITDGRKLPIDIGDMPEDMDLELTKVALYEIIEKVLEKYKDGNLEAKSLRHNVASDVFKKIVEEGWYLNLNTKKKEESKYTLPQIIEAVDIAIGDDGFRSKEVAEILKVDVDGELTTADEYNNEWLKLRENNEKDNYLLINDRINELLERIQVLETQYKASGVSFDSATQNAYERLLDYKSKLRNNDVNSEERQEIVRLIKQVGVKIPRGLRIPKAPRDPRATELRQQAEEPKRRFANIIDIDKEIREQQVDKFFGFDLQNPSDIFNTTPKLEVIKESRDHIMSKSGFRVRKQKRKGPVRRRL